MSAPGEHPIFAMVHAAHSPVGDGDHHPSELIDPLEAGHHIPLPPPPPPVTPPPPPGPPPPAPPAPPPVDDDDAIHPAPPPPPPPEDTPPPPPPPPPAPPAPPAEKGDIVPDAPPQTQTNGPTPPPAPPAAHDAAEPDAADASPKSAASAPAPPQPPRAWDWSPRVTHQDLLHLRLPDGPCRLGKIEHMCSTPFQKIETLRRRTASAQGKLYYSSGAGHSLRVSVKGGSFEKVTTGLSGPIADMASCEDTLAVADVQGGVSVQSFTPRVQPPLMVLKLPQPLGVAPGSAGEGKPVTAGVFVTHLDWLSPTNLVMLGNDYSVREVDLASIGRGHQGAGGAPVSIDLTGASVSHVREGIPYAAGATPRPANGLNTLATNKIKRAIANITPDRKSVELWASDRFGQPWQCRGSLALHDGADIVGVTWVNPTSWSGQYLVTAGADARLRVWDAADIARPLLLFDYAVPTDQGISVAATRFFSMGSRLGVHWDGDLQLIITLSSPPGASQPPGIMVYRQDVPEALELSFLLGQLPLYVVLPNQLCLADFSLIHVVTQEPAGDRPVPIPAPRFLHPDGIKQQASIVAAMQALSSSVQTLATSWTALDKIASRAAGLADASQPRPVVPMKATYDAIMASCKAEVETVERPKTTLIMNYGTGGFDGDGHFMATNATVLKELQETTANDRERGTQAFKEKVTESLLAPELAVLKHSNRNKARRIIVDNLDMVKAVEEQLVEAARDNMVMSFADNLRALQQRADATQDCLAAVAKEAKGACARHPGAQTTPHFPAAPGISSIHPDIAASATKLSAARGEYVQRFDTLLAGYTEDDEAERRDRENSVMPDDSISTVFPSSDHKVAWKRLIDQSSYNDVVYQINAHAGANPDSTDMTWFRQVTHARRQEVQQALRADAALVLLRDACIRLEHHINTEDMDWVITLGQNLDVEELKADPTYTPNLLWVRGMIVQFQEDEHVTDPQLKSELEVVQYNLED